MSTKKPHVPVEKEGRGPHFRKHIFLVLFDSSCQLSLKFFLVFLCFLRGTFLSDTKKMFSSKMRRQRPIFVDTLL